jgi:hypothetical protein
MGSRRWFERPVGSGKTFDGYGSGWSTMASPTSVLFRHLIFSDHDRLVIANDRIQIDFLWSLDLDSDPALCLCFAPLRTERQPECCSSGVRSQLRYVEPDSSISQALELTLGSSRCVQSVLVRRPWYWTWTWLSSYYPSAGTLSAC